MHANLESIFDEAENRYLKPDELGLISQYVESLPERLECYRKLRDNELEVMQLVVNDLQAELPQESVETLERCVKNSLLTLRYCAMGMLLNDEALIHERLLSWLVELNKIYATSQVDSVLFRLMDQHLSRILTSPQMGLLEPMLLVVQRELLDDPTTQSLSATGLGW
jgi:Phycobilisome protein